jgi:hypothetical protein
MVQACRGRVSARIVLIVPLSTAGVLRRQKSERSAYQRARVFVTGREQCPQKRQMI